MPEDLIVNLGLQRRWRVLKHESYTWPPQTKSSDATHDLKSITNSFWFVVSLSKFRLLTLLERMQQTPLSVGI